MSALTTREARLRRHRRVRGKVAGTAERPRLTVFRSNRGVFAQLVDDTTGKTLAGASWNGLPKSFKGDKRRRRTKSARPLAAAAKKAGHRIGRLRPRWVPVPRTVKALAEGAREGGLIF